MGGGSGNYSYFNNRLWLAEGVFCDERFEDSTSYSI